MLAPGAALGGAMLGAGSTNMLNEMILWNYWGQWTSRRGTSVRISNRDHSAEEEAAFERRMALARGRDGARPKPRFVVVR